MLKSKALWETLVIKQLDNLEAFLVPKIRKPLASLFSFIHAHLHITKVPWPSSYIVYIAPFPFWPTTTVRPWGALKEPPLPVGILGHSPWPTERRTQGPKQTHQSHLSNSNSCTTRETHATTQMMARNPDVGMYPSRGTGKTVHPVNESTTRIPRVTVITTLKTIFAVIILTLLQRGPPSSQHLQTYSASGLRRRGDTPRERRVQR